MWEENLGTQGGVRLIEGVRLMWGPLNTSFTVEPIRRFDLQSDRESSSNCGEIWYLKFLYQLVQIVP